MILTCPSCGTQYVVKDGAIPTGGRQVRCAACKHSWHQDPEANEPDAPDAQSPIADDARGESDLSADNVGDGDESIAEATLIEPRGGPEAEERAFEEAVVAGHSEVEPAGPGVGGAPAMEPAPMTSHDWREPPQQEAQDDEFSPFAATEDFAPRRSRPVLTIVLIAVFIAALAAAFWFLAPSEWKAALGLGPAGASPLALVTTHMDRQRLESGNELLTVTGRVINPTGKDQDVPPLQAQLRTRTGRIVYEWTIAPPARTLSPGASASFNSAEVNVPPGGEELTISVGTAAG